MRPRHTAFEAAAAAGIRAIVDVKLKEEGEMNYEAIWQRLVDADD
jgi:hypothetical protein